MKGNASTHERLAERLAGILTKLNIGHQLSVQEKSWRVSFRSVPEPLNVILTDSILISL